MTIKKETVEGVTLPGGPYGEGQVQNVYHTAGDNFIGTVICDSCDPKERRYLTMIAVNEELACGLKKGMTEQQITQILGKPDIKQDDEHGVVLFYYISEKQDDNVSLSMDNGRLKYLGATDDEANKMSYVDY